MPLHMLGGAMVDAPFNRTFFNVTLGEILSTDGKERERKLLLHLTDGASLQVCSIDAMSDLYLTLRAYAKEEEGCETTLHLIPYSLICRIEIEPRSGKNPNHVGFRWTPATGRKSQASRRSTR